MPFLFLTAFCFPDDFADGHAIEPNFNLINKESLEKILKAEIFVHKDGQLRAAHLILGYTPISSSFQAPKGIIKAKDPRLHQISVAGPIPECVLTTNPIPEGIPKVALPFQQAAKEEATPSQPANKEKEEVVDISESEDDFEVFSDFNPSKFLPWISATPPLLK